MQNGTKWTPIWTPHFHHQDNERINSIKKKGGEGTQYNLFLALYARN
jgi:hypothetical protein